MQWIASDITKAQLVPGSIDLWHDRATLHFLTDPAGAAAYVRAATSAIVEGGFAVIGCFASDGPEKCSQLDVARCDPEQIAALFGGSFSLVQSRRESHATPSGAPQAFTMTTMIHSAHRLLILSLLSVGLITVGAIQAAEPQFVGPRNTIPRVQTRTQPPSQLEQLQASRDGASVCSEVCVKHYGHTGKGFDRIESMDAPCGRSRLSVR